jgi:hypothetical protein
MFQLSFFSFSNSRFFPFSAPIAIVGFPVPLAFNNRFDNLCHLGDGAELFPWLMRQTEGRALHAMAPVAGYQLPQTVAKYKHWKDHACFADITKLKAMVAQAVVTRQGIAALPPTDPLILQSQRMLKKCIEAQQTCVQALTTCEDPDRLIIIALGGTETIFAALRSASSSDRELQLKALEAIKQLYDASIHDMHLTLGDGLQFLVECLDTYKDPVLLQYVLWTLGNLLVIPNTFNCHTASQNALRELDIATTVASLFYSNRADAATLRALLYVIDHFTRGNPANQTLMTEKQVIFFISTSITSHSDDVNIQGNALGALASIVQNHDSNKQLVGQHFLPTIFVALENQPSVVDVQTNGIACLLYCAYGSPANIPTFLKAGALKFVASAMQRFPTDTQVLRACILLLSTLVADSDPNLVLVYESVGIAAIHGALDQELNIPAIHSEQTGRMLRRLQDYESQLSFSV